MAAGAHPGRITLELDCQGSERLRAGVVLKQHHTLVVRELPVCKAVGPGCGRSAEKSSEIPLASPFDQAPAQGLQPQLEVDAQLSHLEVMPDRARVTTTTRRSPDRKQTACGEAVGVGTGATAAVEGDDIKVAKVCETAESGEHRLRGHGAAVDSTEEEPAQLRCGEPAVGTDGREDRHVTRRGCETGRRTHRVR